MFNLFSTKPKLKNFDYLNKKDLYFDSACQTLRPQEVINAEIEYYQKYNACGHRVKYRWGQIVDQKIEDTRKLLLQKVGKSDRDYSVAFCLNTTSGINQILHQLNHQKYEQIVTSDIEHNSVFLPTLTWSKKYSKPRLVLERTLEGGLIYQPKNLASSVVVLNSTSNIDGRELVNIQDVANQVRQKEGLLLLDACQTLAHNPDLLKKVDFDACFGSGHKMYGPSVGFIIIKKKLLTDLQPYMIGGNTVQEVKLDSYELIDQDKQMHARIEPGLQNFAGICALGKTLNWLNKFTINQKNPKQHEQEMSQYLNLRLGQLPRIKLLNPSPSPIVSLYSDQIDSHKLGMYLAEAGVMCRTGYHCCHYYLKHKLKLPPLFRISIGLNNSSSQIDFLIEKMKQVLEL